MSAERKSFKWNHPLFIVTPKGAAEPAEFGVGDIAGGETTDGRPFAAVFQSEESAQKFVEDAGYSDSHQIGTLQETDFSDWCKRMTKRGFALLAFDVSGREEITHPTLVEIKGIIDVPD